MYLDTFTLGQNVFLEMVFISQSKLKSVQNEPKQICQVLFITFLPYKYRSCVPGVDGKIHPSGFVQQGGDSARASCSIGGDSACRVTAYAARSPRDGFSHPHQEHMIDPFSCIFYFIYLYLYGA